MFFNVLSLGERNCIFIMFFSFRSEHCFVAEVYQLEQVKKKENVQLLQASTWLIPKAFNIIILKL